MSGERNLTECTGIRLKALIRAGIKRFELHKGDLDAMNVFPIPDGDTGKNMYNTFLAVWQFVKQADRYSAGGVAGAAAKGAFQGARGCSGIIFSSLLAGFANAVRGRAVITAGDFARGLSLAASTAYQMLVEPKEGTIITLSKKIALAAERAVEQKATLPEVLSAVCDEGRKALSETPEELPVLKEAGVVDAGASGLLHFFEGMLRYASGKPVDQTDAGGVSATPPHIKEKPIEEYCVEFILQGKEIPLDKLTKTLTDVGHSIIINEGDEKRFKIHIHAIDPKKVFDRTSRFGKPAYIKVDDLSRAQKEYLKNLNK